ncbi:MAG TPA: BMP family ABC transporter substrate-binding protein [Anaerolineae bacterium]|nr:BMP family ABC transporter substrate-binding protein [Anaerolineae bacterium]
MLVALLTLTAILLSGCAPAAAPTPAPARKCDKRVALIIAQGGLGDRSYNDSGYAGLTKAAQDFGVKVKAIESPDPVGQGEKLLRDAAKAGFDLVITLEYTHFDPLARVAPDFPNTMFSIVNIEVKEPNVVSVIFKEHEGSFLAGALAALVAKDTSIPGIRGTKTIGVIGGTKSLGIDKFLVGYEEGAHYIDPDIKVLRAYSETFGDPAKGKELALSMFEQGADVVYQVAGGTGEGIIAAAKETGHYAIGVDSDQDYMAPGHVLTSMLKRVDIAVYDLIKRLCDGTLKGGIVVTYGLKEGGVGLSEMKFTRHIIPKAYIDQVNELRDKIIKGEIKVTDVTAEK